VGRYQVIDRLGSGGMGDVYAVKQILLNKTFALKTLHKSAISDVSIRRFQTEAKATFSLSHPNIITVNEFGLLDDQSPFLVMELVQGESLADRLKSKGTLSVDDALAIMVQVCFGLAYAHELGIVHRDIKPSNIMLVRSMPVGTEGSVKILDFGIAKFTAHPGGEIQALTKTGEIFGSPLYMSPEQCSGQQVDNRADTYAMGCVLFEALTGAPPFVTDSALKTMAMHLNQTAPTLRQAALGAKFSEALEQIVARMLSKDPNQRPSNLSELAHELHAIRIGKQTADRGLSELVATVQAPKSVSTRTLIVSLVLTAIVVSGVTAVVLMRTLHATDKASGLQAHHPVQDPFQRLSDQVPDLANTLRPLSVEELEQADKLKQLTAADRRMIPLEFSKIAACKRIKHLSFTDDHGVNEGLEQLSSLPALKTVDVSHSDFNDVGAQKLALCKPLQNITAIDTRVTDAGLVSLSASPQLILLDLSESGISFAGVSELSKLEQLHHLRLDHCTKLHDQSTNRIVLGRLQYLSLEDADIADDDLNRMYVPELRFVDLNGTNVTKAGIAKLCLNSPALEYVQVEHCPHVSHEDVGSLSQGFKRITFQDVHLAPGTIIPPDARTR
jgi:tRNA A-37 threonylcarbamoyl transferase component Bud32/multisubunit Na+/H+ antiporter MnhC subunit